MKKSTAEAAGLPLVDVDDETVVCPGGLGPGVSLVPAK